MSWRQRCLALHRLTSVAAPSFESSFSGQMSEANLEWRARAQLYCGPHVREEASAAAAAAAEALPSAASASSADAKKSKSLLQAHGTDEALTAVKLPLKREPVSKFDSKSKLKRAESEVGASADFVGGLRTHTSCDAVNEFTQELR